jgi:prepilin-type processing-associated H-X9-DG protein
MKVFGWCVLAFAICMGFLLLFPPIGGGKESARRTACLSNLKQIARAQLLYSDDFDNRLPDRDEWMDVIAPYGKGPLPLVCTSLMKDHDPQIYGYCFNGRLSQATIPAQPELVALVFDSINLARNASGSLASLPVPARHVGDRNNVVYADAHVKSVRNPTPLHVSGIISVRQEWLAALNRR